MILCPAHFKNKDALALASHLKAYTGVSLTVNFHQSNHGKSTYDPEGGVIKAAALSNNKYDRHQDNPVKNAQTFFDFCEGSQALTHPVRRSSSAPQFGFLPAHHLVDPV